MILIGVRTRVSRLTLARGVGLVLLVITIVGAVSLGGLGVVASDDDEGFGDRLSATVDYQEVEALILEKVNQERLDRGLDPLAEQDELAEAGRSHGAHMFADDFYDHITPDGVSHQDRVDATGLSCRASENIAAAFHHRVMIIDGTPYYLHSEEQLADFLVDAWMNSPGHRDNILSEEWVHHGVGVVTDGDRKVFAAHKFCGPMDES